MLVSEAGESGSGQPAYRNRNLQIIFTRLASGTTLVKLAFVL